MDAMPLLWARLDVEAVLARSISDSLLNTHLYRALFVDVTVNVLEVVRFNYVGASSGSMYTA
jgi:hypothetical protein